ncbi:MAG TPA: 3-deoxy-8-phosphooctulonate synthase [Phycisphaerales bacterium]|nr:3-deoxy-8-phosphooctulonate synthase [Phycisphaerales bacterium]
MTDTQTLHEWFDVSQGARPFLIIAGPCVLETPEINRTIGREVSDICADLDIPYVFKASFDKANRSSIGSARGPGAERGLEEIANIGRELSRPTCTDIHLPEQAKMAADHVSLLQIPAFLCRQTDLLCAAAETGAAVNVKKGQFLGPDQMKNVISKVRSAGGQRLMLTERGTFFGYDRLVNDFIGLGDLMELGTPVCFDVTHSTQLPGGGADRTAGRPDRAHLLARAATAAGVHALFIECHPEPEQALSDGSTMQTLDATTTLLRDVTSIRNAMEPNTTTA